MLASGMPLLRAFFQCTCRFGYSAMSRLLLLEPLTALLENKSSLSQLSLCKWCSFFYPTRLNDKLYKPNSIALMQDHYPKRRSWDLTLRFRACTRPWKFYCAAWRRPDFTSVWEPPTRVRVVCVPLTVHSFVLTLGLSSISHLLLPFPPAHV